MLKELNESQKKLAEYMSEISERCWNSGWVSNLEFILYKTIKKGPTDYGHDSIYIDDIKILVVLLSIIDGWIYFDESTEETYISIKDWEIKYKEFLKHT